MSNDEYQHQNEWISDFMNDIKVYLPAIHPEMPNHYFVDGPGFVGYIPIQEF